MLILKKGFLVNFVFLLIKLRKVVLSFVAGHEVVKCEQGHSLLLNLNGETVDFGWKIKWLTPFRLGTFGKYGLSCEAVYFFYSFQSTWLVWLHFVAGFSPTRSYLIVKCLCVKSVGLCKILSHQALLWWFVCERDIPAEQVIRRSFILKKLKQISCKGRSSGSGGRGH